MPLAFAARCHFLAVLVGPREKEHVVTQTGACERAIASANDRRVRVPKMRLGVDVIDWSGDVEA